MKWCSMERYVLQLPSPSWSTALALVTYWDATNRSNQTARDRKQCPL